MTRLGQLGTCIGICALSTLCIALEARAQEVGPERARFDDIAERLLRAPRGEGGAALVEQVWAAWDIVGADAVISVLGEADDDPRSDRWVGKAVTWYLAEGALRQGRHEDARRARRDG